LPKDETEACQQLEDLQASLYHDIDHDQYGGIEIDWQKLFPQLAQSAVKISLSFIPGWDAIYKLTENLKGEPEKQAKAMFDAIQREKVHLHEDQVKSLEQFQDRFARAVELFLAKTQRPYIAVFVDDLDRCLPEKAIEVLEAIKLFLDVRGCVFVIGVDRVVVEKCIESKYAGKPSAVPINGDDYLEKLVQVPFNLPPLEQRDVQEFIDAEIRQNFPPNLAPVFAAGLEANPRKVKRTLNIFRLLWTLAEQRAELKGNILPELLAKIVVVQVRFRDLYNDVVEYPNLLGDLEKYWDTEATSTPGKPSREVGEMPVETSARSTTRPEEGTLVGKYAKEKSLKALLLSGRARFSTVDARPYIFLTRASTAQPEPETPAKVDEKIGDDLLSNDATRLRAALEKIGDKEKLGYIKRLLAVMNDAKTYRAPQRVSAGNALAYLGDPRNLDEMVDIPAGEFLYGDESETRRIAKPFRIGKYLVTNAQYKKFIDANKYDVPFVKEDWAKPYNWDKEKRMFPTGKMNHPVVLVSWNDAKAYCEWLSKTTGKKYRLPTEEEWERAARYTDGREYPWGREFDADKTNTNEGGIGVTSSVGAYPNGTSEEGVSDVSGNVWEWTETQYDKDTRVIRGGSWDLNQDYARCAYRHGSSPVIRLHHLGFRVAESVSLKS